VKGEEEKEVKKAERIERESAPDEGKSELVVEKRPTRRRRN